MLGRNGGDDAGQLAGAGQQRLVGNDLYDQTPIPSRLGVDVVTGQAHAPRPVDSDELG